MNTHVLKTDTPFFEDVKQHRKPFEIRKNDRDFQMGDTLVLCEYKRKDGIFTGRVVLTRVSYMFSSTEEIPGLLDGYVAMGVMFLNDTTLRQLQGVSSIKEKEVEELLRTSYDLW